MHGNVWEWCADSWQNKLGKEAVADPYQHGDKSASRVIRGGSWNDGGRFVRSAFRNRLSPDYRNDILGFRLSLGHELQPSKVR
jgi:formylglycine-generating enzyme required for sulfatase activity